MIAVIDYGMGNLGSIQNMIRKIGAKAHIVSNPEELREAGSIILPGVGAFDNGVEKLKLSGFKEVIEEKVFSENTPFLGICLGMQLLFEGSEEGSKPGLGWIKGNVVKFDISRMKLGYMRVPHMGWARVRIKQDGRLFKQLDDKSRFYFVHSYHVDAVDGDNVAATSVYGYEFTCSVEKGNIFGTQFHPEKSHKYGMKVLENFLKVAM